MFSCGKLGGNLTEGSADDLAPGRGQTIRLADDLAPTMFGVWRGLGCC